MREDANRLKNSSSQVWEAKSPILIPPTCQQPLCSAGGGGGGGLAKPSSGRAWRSSAQLPPVPITPATRAQQQEAAVPK